MGSSSAMSAVACLVGCACDMGNLDQGARAARLGRFQRKARTLPVERAESLAQIGQSHAPSGRPGEPAAAIDHGHAKPIVDAARFETDLAALGLRLHAMLDCVFDDR